MGSSFGIISQTGNNIQTEGLVFYVDAAYKKSYPRTGTTTFNIASGSLTPTGSLINDTGFVGLLTSSFTFDGSDDYINLGTISSLNGGISAFSVSLWINYSGTLSADMLISGGTSTTDDFYIQLTSATNLRYGSGSDYDDITISSISAGTWYNIATVHIGTKVYVYLNGILQGNATTQAPTSNLATNVILGDYLLTGTGYDYAGNIANSLIYNRALSASDVLQNYQAQKGRFGL